MTSLALQAEIIRRIIGPTSNIVDCHKRLAALAYADSKGIRHIAVPIILAARLNWLNWLAVTQRDWQAKTRNHNKAKHADSISIREKYVRCSL